MWQAQGQAFQEQCRINGDVGDTCSLSRKLISDYTEAKTFWLFVISFTYMFSNLLRAIRWQMLLSPLGYSISWYNSLFAVMSGFFFNTAIPRAGEFIRAGVVTKYEQVPFEKAFGTIVIGRIVDMLCLLSMIGLGFVFHYDNLWGYLSENLSISVSTLVILGVMGVAGLITAALVYRRVKVGVLRSSNILVQRMIMLVDGFTEGIGSIRKLPNVSMFVGISAGIWICYFLMHYLAFFAYEPTSHLGPADGLLVFDFGALGVVFPSPGGMGSYHAMVVEALKILDVDALSGFSFAMITFFTLTIFCNVVFGLISLILLPVVNKNSHDSTRLKVQDLSEQETAAGAD